MLLSIISPQNMIKEDGVAFFDIVDILTRLFCNFGEAV